MRALAYRDQGGHSWTRVRDALGRVRDAIQPDGKRRSSCSRQTFAEPYLQVPRAALNSRPRMARVTCELPRPSTTPQKDTTRTSTSCEWACAITTQGVAGQKSLSAAVAAGARGAGDVVGEVKALEEKVLSAGATAWMATKAAALVSRFTPDTRYVFATYTVKFADGSTYSGRTSGIVGEGRSDREAAR
jgi:hypothetical protein